MRRRSGRIDCRLPLAKRGQSEGPCAAHDRQLVTGSSQFVGGRRHRFPGRERGQAGLVGRRKKIVELFKGWKTAFPDSAGTVTSAVGSGNRAVLEVAWKGTHSGPLRTAEGTIPASGKRQETPAAIVFTFEGGKIKESHQYFDLMTLLKQIGVQPK